MSNYLAIATVTEVLKDIVQGAVKSVPGAAVKTLHPSSQKDKNASVNIYMYLTSPNKALRNMDLPTRGRDGSLIKCPQVALNMNYLFSFYGDDAKQEPQRLLGSVAAAIHASPVLESGQVRDVIAKTDFLEHSDLDKSVEQVRFTPIPFTLEESYRLWSTLQAQYALSIAYEARVVVIESEAGVTAPALPVYG